jgi:TonB family protein
MLDLLMLAAAAGAAAPAQSPALPAIGKWTVDWGDTNCIALRNYGDKSKPVTVGLKPSINGDVIRLMISRKGPYQSPAHFDVTVGDVKTTALAFTPKGSGAEIFWINIPRADFDRIASGAMLAIKGRGLNLAVSTQGFPAAITAMNQCNEDLRAEWNADEAGKARIVTRPVALVSPVRLVKPADYPDQAMREGREGATSVSLLIDETGAIKDCVVEQDSGVATIDAQTCVMIQQRGKFSAAKDKDGKPIKSRLFYRFRWEND